MSKKIFLATAAAALCFPTLCWAHPGHMTEQGLLHYFTDPYHMAVAILLAGGSLAAVKLFRRREERARD